MAALVGLSIEIVTQAARAREGNKEYNRERSTWRFHRSSADTKRRARRALLLQRSRFYQARAGHDAKTSLLPSSVQKQHARADRGSEP